MQHLFFILAALSASAAVAQVQVDSLNRLVLGNKFPTVTTQKPVVIECEGEVFLNGGEVLKGGTLDIRAKNVRIGNGFKVHPGGVFKILNR